MDSYALIVGRAWRSEGTETNNLNAVSGAWLWVNNFLESAATTGMQAATSRRLICLRSGGLDRWITFELRNPGLSDPNE